MSHYSSSPNYLSSPHRQSASSLHRSLSPNPRRLPSLPEPVEEYDDQQSLRPLPTLPPSNALSCQRCFNEITNSNAVIRPPPHSRKFRGFAGQAALYSKVINVILAPPKMQLMATGAHTMQEISCRKCDTYLGWQIVKAHEKSERWKEGTALLEQTLLVNLEEAQNRI